MAGLLSIIIPTFNERENVPRLLAALRAALSDIDYELMFVDDSTDGTDQVLRDAARDDPRLIVHHRRDGRGLATAVLRGFELCNGQRIGVMDADLQHPPELLPVMVQRLDDEEADVVIASRYLPGAAVPGLPGWRRLVSQVTRLLAWVLLRAARRSSDPLSGCFIVRRHVIEGLTLRPIGFKILLEILVRGQYQRVAEVPYVFAGRHAGESKATLRQGLDLLRHLTMLTADSPPDARLWKFLLVGVSGVVVNVTVFWLSHHVTGLPVVPAGLVADLISTFTNFLLNNAYTWADRREPAMSTFVQRLGKYYVATWAGRVVYLSLLWGLTRLGMPAMLANLVAIGVGGVLNYIIHNVWTWREQRTGP